MSNGNKGPWGERPSNNGGYEQGPWGTGGGGGPSRGPRGGGPSGPDFTEILKGAKDSLESIFGGGNSGKGIVFILLILIAIWALTGFYRVLPEEHAVMLTFGEWTRTDDEPGLKYHYPWPIQSVEKVSVSLRQLSIGMDKIQLRRGSAQEVNEGHMLTSDESIVDTEFVIAWKVADARDFLFKIRDPAQTLEIVANSAMREVIGQTPLQAALTTGRVEVQTETEQLMRKILADYKAGIQILNVDLKKVDPPAQVIDSFKEVQRASDEKDQMVQQARKYKQDILPRARGQAEQMIQQAEAYKEEVINRAEGDADRFLSVYNSYTKAKDVTAKRMYLETLEQVMQNATKIVIDKDQGVLPWLPLNDIKPAAGSSR